MTLGAYLMYFQGKQTALFEDCEPMILETYLLL